MQGTEKNIWDIFAGGVASFYLHFTVFFQKTISFSNWSLRFFICYDFMAPSYLRVKMFGISPHSSHSRPGLLSFWLPAPELSQQVVPLRIPKGRNASEVLRHWFCQPLRFDKFNEKGQVYFCTLLDRKYIISFHFSMLFVNCSQAVFLFPP